VPPRTFWGFDSFAGFKYFETRDRHPFFREGEFTSDYGAVGRRLTRHFHGTSGWRLVRGYFEDTLAGQTAPGLGIEAAAVALVDCDLGSPAELALRFMGPALQPGSVLILDDYFAYRGDPQAGVAGALARFQDARPRLRLRRLFDYGHGGQGLVVVDPGH
jgi:hypothetical protein